MAEAKKRKKKTGDSVDSYSMAGSHFNLRKEKTEGNFGSPMAGKMTKAASEIGFGASLNMKKAFTAIPGVIRFKQDEKE